MLPSSSSSNNNNKKRIHTRDSQIRKRYAPATPFQQQKPTPPPKTSTRSESAPSSARPGTVAAMNPLPPIIVSTNTSIVEVARQMSGTRSDAVLVAESALSHPQQPHPQQQQVLVGIVTDKDLAYRCVAEGLDPARTPISQIMTQNPVFVSSDESVDRAINLMLNGHFRHLPVVDIYYYNHNNQHQQQQQQQQVKECRIVGLLDITKALMRIKYMIRDSWGKSQALKHAFHEFQSSWHNFTATKEVKRWFEEWAHQMVEPDLTQVLDASATVWGGIPAVGLRLSVRDAAKLMRTTRQTAVLVFSSTTHNLPNPSSPSSSSSPSAEDHPCQSHYYASDLVGIFTTKDIVLRILADGALDPRQTSIVRVMTPHPDTCTQTETVYEVLDRMEKGRYLHLPVVSAVSGTENTATHKDEVSRRTSLAGKVAPLTENNGTRVVGLVDVLGLTYFALEQLVKQREVRPSMLQESPSLRHLSVVDGAATGATMAEVMEQGQQNDANGASGGMLGDEEEGPMWSKFWDGAQQAAAQAAAALGSDQNSIGSGSQPAHPAQGTKGFPTGATSSETGTVVPKSPVHPPSISGSQSFTTVVPQLVDGTGFVFKLKDPLCSISPATMGEPDVIHRFTSRIVGNRTGFSPLVEVYLNVGMKMGCEVVLDADLEAIWRVYGDAQVKCPMISPSTNRAMGERDLEEGEILEGDDGVVQAWVAGSGAAETTAELSGHQKDGVLAHLEKYHSLRFRPLVPPSIITTTTTDADLTSPTHAPSEWTFYSMSLFYKDEESDWIPLRTDDDLLEAIAMARSMGWGRLRLGARVVVEELRSGVLGECGECSVLARHLGLDQTTQQHRRVMGPVMSEESVRAASPESVEYVSPSLSSHPSKKMSAVTSTATEQGSRDEQRGVLDDVVVQVGVLTGAILGGILFGYLMRR